MNKPEIAPIYTAIGGILKDQRSEIDGLLEQQKAELARQKESLERLNAEHLEFTESAKTEHGSVRALVQEGIDGVTERIDRSWKLITDLTSTVDELKTGGDGAAERIENAYRRIADLDTRMAESQGEVGENAEKIDHFSVRLADIDGKLTDKVDARYTALGKSLNALREDLQKQAEATEKQIQDLDERTSTESDAWSPVLSRVTEHQERIGEITELVDDLKDRSAEKSEIENLKKGIAKVAEEIDAGDGLLEEMRKNMLGGLDRLDDQIRVHTKLTQEQYTDILNRFDEAIDGFIDREKTLGERTDTLATRLEEVAAERPQKGDPGESGVGFDVPTWEPGIYRKGTVVQHDFGRVSIATEDTNSKPGEGAEWDRIGSGGFRWTGPKKKEFPYQEGDLYIDGGTTFLFVGGKGKMFAKRGTDGKDGSDGRDGVDAPRPLEFKILDGNESMVAVYDDGSTWNIELPEAFKALSESHATLKRLEEMAEIFSTGDKALSWIDYMQGINQSSEDIPVRQFRGIWKARVQYRRGDAINFGGGLYVATGSTKRDTMQVDEWVCMAGG